MSDTTKFNASSGNNEKNIEDASDSRKDKSKSDSVYVRERKLGPNELMYHLLHQQKPPASTYLHAAVLHSNAMLQIDHIKQTLNYLVEAQPLLRVCISDEHDANGKPQSFFRQMESNIDLQIISKNISGQKEWISIAEKEMLQEFDVCKGPLWRLVVANMNGRTPNNMYCTVLIFVLHHIIVDGKGMVDLLQHQFLPLLGARPIGQQGANVDKSIMLQPMSICPPVEESCLQCDINRAITVPWYLKVGLKAAKLRARLLNLTNVPPLLSLSDTSLSTGSSGGGTGVVPYMIDQSLCKLMVDEGRRHEVSVTCTIITALAYAHDQFLSEKQRTSPNKYFVNLPVDLRRFNDTLNTSPMPLGIYVGGFRPAVKTSLKDFDATNFWKVAKKLKASIDNDMRKLERNRGTNVFASFLLYLCMRHRKDRPLWDELANLGLSFHLSLSNIGICNGPTEVDTGSGGKIELVEQYFNLALGNMKAGLFISALSMRQQIYLMAGYNPRWIASESVHEVFDKMKNVLTAVCDGN